MYRSDDVQSNDEAAFASEFCTLKMRVEFRSLLLLKNWELGYYLSQTTKMYHQQYITCKHNCTGRDDNKGFFFLFVKTKLCLANAFINEKFKNGLFRNSGHWL